MKIGILVYDLSIPRGGTKLALSLGKILQNEGHEIVYTCVYENIRLMEQKFGEKYNFKIYSSKFRFLGNKLNNLTALWNHSLPIYKMCKEFNPDLIIEIGGVISSLFVPILLKIPTIHYCMFPASAYIYSKYNVYKINLIKNLYLRIFRFLEKFIAKRTTNIIAMCKFSKNIAEKIWKIKCEDIIYPPTNINLFKASKNKKKIILCVARYDPYYKFEKLIKIFNRLKRNDYKFYIVGQSEKDYEINYYNKLNRIKNNKNVRLYTNIDFNKLKKLYSNASIFWYPSWAQYGLIIAEAQSSGIPVISFGKDRGPNEIILDKKSGYIINNFEDFYKYTKKLIKNKNLWRKMSLAARKNAIKRLSDDEFKKKFIKIINEFK